ncbi:hypothetical protein KL86DPRO_50056 [uncultured delta proteobacterium]|uniref:FeoB-associated Cys-rich membrane protein n=1 Tax=uncultured delta proteobacterium TaxID=34034 RepID=A0A212KBD5_9DELT|nr:hypothetical protein KL86DPRO_50056 [uncultured delta proteobacterium]
MVDAIVVGLIVLAAAGYLVYRYVFKKSGGCSCGCGGGCGGDSGKSCGSASVSACCQK